MDVSSLLASPTTWLVTAASTVYLLYWYGTRTFDYFSKQGVPGPKPIPFIGNLWGLWRKNLPIYDRQLVKQYGRTFGYFDGTQPILWTTDIDLIKSIFVKDFDHFINRRDYKVSSKVVRKMLTEMQDQEWKDVRSSITPAFTTGKIKRMSAIITECANCLVDKFLKLAETQGKIDAKTQLSAFTMDVIARSVFGMTINNLDEKDNPFMIKAKGVFSPPANKSPIILIPFMFPRLMTYFSEKIFLGDGFQFFITVLEDLVKQRSNSPEKYHDFVEVATETIMEYTKEVGGKHTWGKDEVDEIVIAQSVLFLLAGFDTTATTLTSSIVLLAQNPDIQEKLHGLIAEKSEKFEQINHEMVLDFPYLDHVIHEVLRMFPPVPRVERQCNRDVSYKNVTIEKNIVVIVPTFALHYDEEYYPEPYRFNPDRWNADSPIKPNPNAYMPFGMGPRSCVGTRFAIEEMKIALCSILKNFRFFPVEETPEEMQFEDGFIAVAQPIQATVGIECR